MTEHGDGFAREVDPYRAELVVHCYRMLGSPHEAEDVVQETYLRAWRARDQYDPSRSSQRTWMYRIATNACLTALGRGARRPLPSGLVAESDPRGPLVPDGEVLWLQPIPDAMVRGVADGSVRLAFVAALQRLSARQRAVLILRDVLDFSAAETAEIIGATVIAVNSSLRRARSSIATADLDRISEPPDAGQRALIDRYMTAFVAADVEGIKRLLAEDVLMEMPPMVNWFRGRDSYAIFMRWVFEAAGTDWRLRPVGTNGQPAFAAYRHVDNHYQLHTLQVLTVSAAGVSRLTVFQGQEVFAVFGLESKLAA